MTVIARRYAKAFFDLAVSQSKIVKFQDQLHWIGEAFKSVPDLLKILCDERTPISKRHAIVDAVGKQLNLDALTIQFWKVLIDKNRMNCWEDILAAFNKFAAKAANVVKADVTTAVPLGEAQKFLESALAQLTKKTVDMQLTVNPDIIGGAVVQIDDTIYDGSIATELKRLKEKLNSLSS